jgi:hypothetical protein
LKFLTDLVLPTVDSDSKIVSPLQGSIYFNTLTKTVRIYDGTKWYDLAFLVEADEVEVDSTKPVKESVVLWIDPSGGTGSTTPPPVQQAEDEVHVGTQEPTTATVVIWVDPDNGATS